MARLALVVDMEEVKGKKMARHRIEQVRECAINVKARTVTITATPERLQEMLTKGELETVCWLAESAL